MKEIRKVNILGREYSLSESNAHEDSKLVGNDGYCDCMAGIIVTVDDLNNDPDLFASADQKGCFNYVFRHEIIHAYFGESGLLDYSNDEKLVDWIAIQFPKMLKTFRELNVI